MLYMFLALILGYLLGSIPFSYLFGKWFGHKDVRQFGSGNVGTTNVIRTVGKKVGVLAFIGDFLKGVAASCLGFLLADTEGAALAGAASVFGHCYSVFLKFTGGKGVATAAGAAGAIVPILWLWVFPIFALVVVISGYVSLGSLSVFVFAIGLGIVTEQPWPVMVMFIFLNILTFYRHRANIVRLYRGEEPKIKKRLFK